MTAGRHRVGVLTNDTAAANARLIAEASGVDGIRQSNPSGVQWRHPDTDQFHRLDGPAVVREEDLENNEPGFEAWYVDGIVHRLDGPAQTSVNGQRWVVNGVLHRLDGPATIRPVTGDGDVEVGWWVNGHEVTEPWDQEWLQSLYDAGAVAELEMVLTLWRPEGPTARELSQAVRAATA